MWFFFSEQLDSVKFIKFKFTFICRRCYASWYCCVIIVSSAERLRIIPRFYSWKSILMRISQCARVWTWRCFPSSTFIVELRDSWNPFHVHLLRYAESECYCWNNHFQYVWVQTYVSCRCGWWTFSIAFRKSSHPFYRNTSHRFIIFCSSRK